MTENSPQFTAVILVGGQGTRLQPLTLRTPKAMVSVLNRPFLEHTIAYLRNFGVDSIVLALSYLPGVIRDYLGDSRFGTRLNYCLEEEPLGTAGAVKNAESYLKSTFIVLNGDVFTDLDIAEMLASHKRRGAVATIALVRVEDPSAFGVVETDASGRVLRFTEKPPPGEAASDMINAGVYILEPEVLALIPENSHYMFENGLFPHLLELGKPVFGYPLRGYWIDMGSPGKYFRLNQDLLLGKVRGFLNINPSAAAVLCGEKTQIHPEAKISGPVLLGKGCVVEEGASIFGPVVIGDGCLVGRGAVIERSLLLAGTEIGRDAHVSGCILSEKTQLPQEKRVRDSILTPQTSAILKIDT